MHINSCLEFVVPFTKYIDSQCIWEPSQTSRLIYCWFWFILCYYWFYNSFLECCLSTQSHYIWQSTEPNFPRSYYILCIFWLTQIWLSTHILKTFWSFLSSPMFILHFHIPSRVSQWCSQYPLCRDNYLVIHD